MAPAPAVLLVLLVLLVTPAIGDAPGGLRFVDATAASGIDARTVNGAPPGEKRWLAEGMGSGAAWLDHDGDGDLDLYLVNGSSFDRPAGAGEPNRLYRNDGGGAFTDVTDAAGVGHRGWGSGVAVGDHDGDGDPDLYVTNRGPNVLYRNDGDGTFTDVTAVARVGDERFGTSAAFFDADGDGDLDLYVANYMEDGPGRVPPRGSAEAVTVHCMYKSIPVFCGPLGQTAQQDVFYRNDGAGRFEEATREAGLWLEKPRYGLGVVTLDYDGDGDQDVYVANDSVVNSLWRNRGDGTFEDVGLTTMSALNADGREQAGMGTAAGDYDGDGRLDLVVTNFAHDLNTLYRNVDGRFFIDESLLAGMGVTQLSLSWGTGFQDVDLDSDLDLFIANGHVYSEVDAFDLGTRYRQRNHLLVNDGRGRFSERSSRAGPGFAVERSFRGAAFADYDEDGDVDVLVTAMDDRPLLLRNDTVPRGHWLAVRLVGTKGNRDGVGARVTLTAGGRSRVRERHGGGSYLSASDPRLRFGLGAAVRAERIEVRWSSGEREVVENVAADITITLMEGSAGRAAGKRP